MSDYIYEEVGRNYRFFATWRHIAVAAGVVVVGAAFKVGLDEGFEANSFKVAALGGFFAQLILLWFDFRTIDLVIRAVEKGKKLEGCHEGFFHVAGPSQGWASHTDATRVFHVSAAIGLLLLWYFGSRI